MKRNLLIIFKIVVLITGYIFVFTALRCTDSIDRSPISASIVSVSSPVTGLAVRTGLTDSLVFNPITLITMKDSLLNRTFIVSWNRVENAVYYEVRISPDPIDDARWELLPLVASVPDTGSSEKMETKVKVGPEVYKNVCTACGECVKACPHSAITIMGNRAVIDPAKCTSCGQCFRTCRFKALSNSCYGEAYYFAVRAFFQQNAATEISSTAKRYKMRYTNWSPLCGLCGEACYILLDACGPGCPVDAVWYDDSGLVHIDTTKCINCGQCYIQCHEYGDRSIRQEVVEVP